LNFQALVGASIVKLMPREMDGPHTDKNGFKAVAFL